jgi:NTE family protein
MTRSNRPKIGLALGSGGARGLAHIGVIKILEKNHIPIDYIAGSSIGAMVGGYYASGLNTGEIEKIASSTNWREMFSILFDPHLKQGLIEGKKVEAFIDSHIDGEKFENCKIPFSVVATDLKTGDIVILDKGKLAPAIRASISIPLVFKPVEFGDKMLADGGLSAPIPTEIVRNMGADIVIAVNLDKYCNDENWKPGWYGIANDSLDILRHHLAILNTKSADIVIEMDLGKEYWYEFINGQDKILAGEEATKRILPQLRKLIRQKSRHGLGKFLDFFKF